MNSKSRILYICFYSKNCSDLTPVQCFYTFSYPSHLKHLFLIVFLEGGLPEMLSQLDVLAERDIKKSKKHNAITPIAKTPCKVPGRENSDCENTMKMKIRFQNYKCYCAFCWFLCSIFHFHDVLPWFWMHFCSKAAQKLLLAAPDRFWQLLVALGCSWPPLAAPGRSWLLLAAPGSSWWLLAAPGVKVP